MTCMGLSARRQRVRGGGTVVMTCTLAGVAGAAGVAGVAGAGAGAAGGRGRRSQGRSRSQDGARMVVSAVLLAVAVGAALVLVVRDALSRGGGG